MMSAGRSAGLLAGMLATTGCLELNPSYVDANSTGEPTTTATTENDATTGAAASTDSMIPAGTGTSTTELTTGSDASGSSTGSDACAVDLYEPNDYANPSDVSPGFLDGVLNPADDVDAFKVPINPGGPAEIIARASPAMVRTCIYAECDDGTPLTLTKCTGVMDTDSTGRPGCCDATTVSIEYDCSGNFGIIAHVRVDQGASACEPYQLEVGTPG